MKYEKVRGQKRKLKILLRDIDKIQPRFDYDGECEHYHIPCGFWISSPKNSSRIQTEFIKKWIDKTKEIIDSKPENDKFCKVVASIVYPDFWSSQITIFYDEEYYNTFFDRKGPYQTWTKIEGISFVKNRHINMSLKEQGYNEVIDNKTVCEDEDEIYRNQIWFYGEL